MKKDYKESISVTLTIGILALTLFIIHRFIPSLVWAGIIAIATYPLFHYWQRMWGKWRNLSAFVFTAILALFLVLPISWLISVLVTESQLLFNYLQDINLHGGQAPAFLKQLPLFGNDITVYWDKNIGQPGNVKHWLSNLHLSLTPTGHYITLVGSSIARRGFQIGFTILILFFFYRDGESMFKQIHRIGDIVLGDRWSHYADRLPAALRGIVNGTIVVGMGVGILMGVCYALLGFPAPTLVGFVTALAAMIPFAVPVVFVAVAFVLFIQGSMIAAIIVLAWGTFVMFVADHFVKPVLIGGSIQLPFLAVLFGILGGVETLGLLGLFIGPMIMVLFITLWNELQKT